MRLLWLAAVHACLLALIFAVVRVHALTNLDLSIAHAFTSLRTPTVTAFMLAATSLGNTFSIVVIAAGASLTFLLSKKNKLLSAGLVCTVLGAKVSETLLKILIERDRPNSDALFHLDTFSFPSGHATAAAALFGYLGLVLIRLYPRWRIAIAVCMSVVILLIGLSRVYLGVHFPSDIIGGYLLGAVWVLVGVWVVRYGRT